MRSICLHGSSCGSVHPLSGSYAGVFEARATSLEGGCIQGVRCAVGAAAGGRACTWSAAGTAGDSGFGTGPGEAQRTVRRGAIFKG